MSPVALPVRARKPRHRATRSRLFSALAAAVVLVLTGTTVIGSMVTAPPAYAATGALEVTKVVDATETLEAGDEFTYTVKVACQDADCINATLADPLPDEFVGFGIVGAPVVPTSAVLTDLALNDCTDTVTADCELVVTALEPLDAGGVGLPAGNGFTLIYTLKVPQDLSPTWAHNGDPITNAATAAGDNAATVTASAEVTVVIPVDVDVAVTKSWAPASQQYQPGVQSTLALGIRNTSNLGAASLVLQDPKVAADAQATLPASNPFRIVDFAGFGTVVPPQGADQVQVDAYVSDGATWSWQSGTPTDIASITLPGVPADQVAGLRFTFTDAAGQPVIAAEGTAGSVQLIVEQRSSDRQTGDALVLGASASNVVTGTVTVPDEDPKSVDATAPYAIGGLDVVVEASKTISPADIPAGGTSTGQVSAKNNSNGPLATLTISDTGFFSDEVLFAGFTAAPTWPAGATTAQVTWVIDGTPQAPVDFVTGSAPAVPTGTVTGFALTFTGQIPAGATGGASFTIDTTTSLVSTPADSPQSLTNVIDVSGTNPAGTGSDSDDAPLRVHYPSIGLSLDKTVSPAGAVNIGGTVVVQLPAVTEGDSEYVRPNEIVVTDQATGADDDFWEAFNPVGIAPTQVPAGSVLTVEYTTDGMTWTFLDDSGAAGDAKVFETAIPSGLATTVTGLRFTFTDADDFAQQTGVTPAIVFEARSALRTSGDPVATSATDPETYQNVAVAEASGVIDSTTVSSGEKTADAAAEVVANPGSGQLYVGKDWRTPNGNTTKATVTSQSNESVRTRLSWGVPTPGYTQVTITDAASGEANSASTTFQAFDLTRVVDLPYSSNPLLKWDEVSAIHLYYNGVWNPVAAPEGDWTNSTGFTGYTLTPSEVLKTTGVRITVVPDDAARAESDDPTRPAVDSGIAFGAAGANRHFDLQWTLRNTLREPVGGERWATGTTPFNSGTDGTVRNTVNVTASHPDTPASGSTFDDISLLDFAPNVGIDLGVSETTVVIPNPGDIADADYPTVDLTLTAQSTSVPRASYLRVSTPACGTTMPDCVSPASDWAANPYTGASYDAAANPFERVTLTGLTFTVPSEQVSKDHSLVTLWLRNADGTFNTRVLSITDAEALPASELTDVVGVSVVYQGVDPATNGGSIVNGADLVMVLHTQVRELLRSGGATDFVTPGAINSVGVAQSYDPVLHGSGSQATPNASDPGDFTLVSGVLDATAAKQFTPDVVLERDRTADIQVRLHATDGASTAPTHRVTLTDVDAEFWDAVTLTSLGAVTLPHGADQVRVDVQTGDSTWVPGTAAAAATLPAVDPADVTGIRFTFDRADGALFSTDTLPADWEATALLNVNLRDTLRSNGDAISFPESIDNTLQVESARTEVPVIFASASDAADDTLTLDTGTYGLDVVKSIAGNIHTIDPGEQAAWTLQFTNTGTGYLTVGDLVDTLPSHLTFTGEEPVYSTTGTLSTAVVLDTTTAGELAFTWPSGGKRMSPGEVFTITLNTVLQPSVEPRATNQFVVTVDQTLGACTNASGNGQGVLAGLPATECGTSNFVQPRAGASIVAYKGVKGEIDGVLVDGAVNVSNPARDCVADADGFYVSPCAANTVVGATDQWSLRTVNSGTEAVNTLTIVEPLPTAGDRMLATGSDRASTWRPLFDEAYGINTDGVPAGTTVSWEVSTDAAVCVGTGAPTWAVDPTCTGNTWTDSTSFSGDWASVTGVRVLLDFTTTPDASLQPGDEATLLFQTVNEPATAADPTLAPVTVPAADQYAWNQFGATATFPISAPMRRAPIKAGVTLPTGQLEVLKQVTGGAAAFAPDEFLVDVTCTIAGAPMNLGSLARLSLNALGGLESAIDGIPLGAECSVNEVGAIGEFGETNRSGDDTTVSIMLPSSHAVTITNDYAWGQLSVTKTEDRAFVAIGQEVTYTITVANEGERTAFDRTVTDSLPTGATLISTAPTATPSGADLSWQVDELAPGESVEFTVVVEYGETGRYINRATVDNPSGPWQPVSSDKPCADDPESACTNVTVAALTVTGIVWLDWALLFAGILVVFGLLVFWGTRRSLHTR